MIFLFIPTAACHQISVSLANTFALQKQMHHWLTGLLALTETHFSPSGWSAHSLFNSQQQRKAVIADEEGAELLPRQRVNRAGNCLCQGPVCCLPKTSQQKGPLARIFTGSIFRAVFLACVTGTPFQGRLTWDWVSQVRSRHSEGKNNRVPSSCHLSDRLPLCPLMLLVWLWPPGPFRFILPLHPCAPQTT